MSQQSKYISVERQQRNELWMKKASQLISRLLLATTFGIYIYLFYCATAIAKLLIAADEYSTPWVSILIMFLLTGNTLIFTYIGLSIRQGKLFGLQNPLVCIVVALSGIFWAAFGLLSFPEILNIADFTLEISMYPVQIMPLFLFVGNVFGGIALTAIGFYGLVPKGSRMTRDSAVVVRFAHNEEAGGSNPPPAIMATKNHNEG